MSVSSLALAQGASPSGVTESTDPAKIAQIEQHAQQLASGGATSDVPMMQERQHMRRRAMRHHRRAMHRREMREKAQQEAPMANDSKG